MYVYQWLYLAGRHGIWRQEVRTRSNSIKPMLTVDDVHYSSESIWIYKWHGNVTQPSAVFAPCTSAYDATAVLRDVVKMRPN